MKKPLGLLRRSLRREAHGTALAAVVFHAGGGGQEETMAADDSDAAFLNEDALERRLRAVRVGEGAGKLSAAARETLLIPCSSPAP